MRTFINLFEQSSDGGDNIEQMILKSFNEIGLNILDTHQFVYLDGPDVVILLDDIDHPLETICKINQIEWIKNPKIGRFGEVVCVRFDYPSGHFN